MQRDEVLDIFRGEAERLGQVAAGLSEREWDKPTACEPWRVRGLFGHVHMTVDRLPRMLAGEAPARAEVDAVRYYRPGARFGSEANAERIHTAEQHAAAYATGALLAQGFIRSWQRADRLCAAEPADRVVRTRHGDAMLLTDFLVTRVVELVVHGFDLAAALDREPWPTARGAAAVEELLLGKTPPEALEGLGWDRTTFLRKATGRLPISEAEAGQAQRLELRWLTLG